MCLFIWESEDISQSVVCDVVSVLPEDWSMCSELARSVGKGQLDDQQVTMVSNTHTV